jgi:hypothetical protein
MSTISLFAQHLDEGGSLAGQADGPLLGLRTDLLALEREWLVTDVREIPVETNEESLVLIGMYDFVSGQRFPTIDGGGRPLPDNALRIPVQGCLDSPRQD